MLNNVTRGFKYSRKWIWTNTDPISKWAQILALVLAAYWTITRYLLVEAPSLEQTIAVHSTLREDFRSENGCYVQYVVDITNTGNVSFDVSRIQIRAWRTDLPGLNAFEEPKFLDPDEIEYSEPFIDTNRDFKTFTSQALIRHYSARQNFSQHFDWVIPIRHSRLYIFRTDVYSEKRWLGYAESSRRDICIN